MSNYVIYWLINESNDRTYTGFSDNIKRRINEHKEGKIKTTKNFGKFRCCILDNINNLVEAREREKYWKSAAGRRKIKRNFERLKRLAAIV